MFEMYNVYKSFGEGDRFIIMRAYVFNEGHTYPVEIDEDIIIDSEEFEFFDDRTVRKVWHLEKEEWFFSLCDIVEALTESTDPKQYIKKMRSRDKELNSNWGTICTLVPMISLDGKMHRIQSSTIEGILRMIQSIPSPKAEPFKQWLAKVGAERLDEMADPEKAMERAVTYYQAKGYSDKWISQRIRAKSLLKHIRNLRSFTRKTLRII